MAKNIRPLIKFDSYNNAIRLSRKINSYILGDFSAAVQEWQSRGRKYEHLILDFSAVEHPYSNGMLAILATVSDLRLKGHNFKVILPNNFGSRSLFLQRNWAYFLDPKNFKASDSTYDRHMVARRFTDEKDLAFIVKDFMDVVLRSMDIPKDVFSALEWSIYEICDNVINHSNSKIGGFVEVITFTKQDMISFTVADAGRGILNSLKEAIPTLRTDAQAIGEAIKAGVTRNKSVGQGNGLAGTLRITAMTGGSLDITSGTGRFIATVPDTHKTEAEKKQSYRGTVVSGNIKTNRPFSIGKALDFGTGSYKAVDTIDMDYEMAEEDSLLMRMSAETTGFGTRNAGRQLRTITLNLIRSKPGYPIYIDWEGVPVIASSFADEFIGKLFLEMGPMNFMAQIKNKNMEALVRQLLDKAIAQRLTQEKDN